MPDEMTTMLELPPSARALTRARSAYRRFAYEIRHPENHKQVVRFLCVGVSGYLINLATFALCIHLLLPNHDDASLVVGFLVSSTSNFVWNRHWTFGAKEDHPFLQGVRFFAVSIFVFFFAFGIYHLLVDDVGLGMKTVADGISWIIATPLSFVLQKLWTFKA